MGNPFKFKQFEIHQDRCAMKIGTDGVLLGSWVNWVDEPKRILDIGTGTGLIALMLAQRTENALIDAIEIDALAAQQSSENFASSSFSDRVNSINISLQEFNTHMQYDLVISNPPFFTINQRTKDLKRQTARQTSSLNFQTLLSKTKELLSGNGTAAFILPYDRENEFFQEVVTQNLYVGRITRVKGNPQSPVKRSLFLIHKMKIESSIDNLTLEIERHKYTPEYQSLVKDFYLNL